MINSIGLIESKGLVALIEATDVILKNSPVTILGIHKLGNGLVSLAIAGNAEYVKAAIESGTEAGRRVGEIYASSVVENPDKKLLDIFFELYSDGIVDQQFSKNIEEVKFSSVSDQSALKFKSTDIKKDAKREKSKLILKTGLSTVQKKNQKTKLKPDQQIKKDLTNNFNEQNEKSKTEKIITPEIENIALVEKTESISKLSTIERLRKEALGLSENKIKINANKNVTKYLSAESNNKISANDNNDVDFDSIEKMNVHKLRRYAREFSNFPIKGRAISRASRDELVELFNSISKQKIKDKFK